MRMASKTILIITLFLVVVGSADTAKTGRMTAKEKRTKALELLEKFTESRKISNSYIIKAHEKCTYTYSGFKGIGTSYKDLEFLSDGNRCKYVSSIWGDVNIKYRGVKKGQGDYYSTLWDGEKAYAIGKSDLHGDGRASVQIIKKSDPGDHEKTVSVEYKNSYVEEMNGYHWGDLTRIDELFLKSDTKLQLQGEKSNVRGVDCYVIKADVPGRGEYTVWIDPVHDFHIARIRVQRKEGDHILGRLMEQSCTSKELYEVLEFEKAGDVWCPKTIRTKRVGRSDDYHTSNEREISFSMITLNPDHDALGSFLPDYIPNGSDVYFRAFHEIKFIWRDGKVVDKDGKVVMDCLKKRKGNNK